MKTTRDDVVSYIVSHTDDTELMDFINSFVFPYTSKYFANMIGNKKKTNKKIPNLWKEIIREEEFLKSINQ